MQQVVFGIVAAMIVFAAVRLVTTRNLVHGALYLLGVLVAWMFGKARHKPAAAVAPAPVDRS